MKPSVLIAGIGNIFFGDDAFGVELAHRLASIEWPEAVRVVDFGIRGLDLAYAMADGYEVVILLDATPRGGEPGTLYALELPPCGTEKIAGVPPIETHQLDPVRVLELAASLGARMDGVFLVGCEPVAANEEDGFGAELSPAVRRAVEEAVPLVGSLVERCLAGGANRGTRNDILVNVESASCRD